MKDLDFALDEIRRLSKNPAMLNDAERRLSQLIETLPPVELVASQARIQNMITRCFFPKRQRNLQAVLAAALGGTPTDAKVRGATPIGRVSGPLDAQKLFRSEIHAALINLADRYLFQWAEYELTVVQLFERQIPDALANGLHLVDLHAILRNEVMSHAKEIYQRGFAYSTTVQQLSPSAALSKGTAGLVRFLDIAVNEYTRQLGFVRAAATALRLRATCSALVAGILLGRSNALFGTISGAAHLADNWKVWIHFTPFMTHGDLDLLILALPAGPVKERLHHIIRPLAGALDEHISRVERVFALRGSHLVSQFDRLELTLVEPIQLADKQMPIHCYLTAERIDRLELESASNRGMQLILAPLTNALDKWIWTHDTLRHIVIDTAKSDVADRMRGSLAMALGTLGSTAEQDLPITYNYASRFPLDKPDIGTEFRVRRASVQELMERHQHETGVRLWCSVRRSGKTTACLDLQAIRGPAVVITETCERIGALNLRDSFYQAVLEALRLDAQLPTSFVADTIHRCADYDVGSSKIVFVLDEYESLFKQLDVAARGNDRTRYSVVQPLLNQLLEFAQRNLVILLGLQPDAHFILMDQNQLSPYVRADSFPLFAFASNQPDCEFRDLVRRILTERIDCDDAFVGHLYAETGGHPALTVNVLTSFCQWLIDTRRPLSQLNLSGSDFDQFGKHHLSPDAIKLNEVYDVHRHFCAQGLSEESRQRTPWLYSVLQVLRLIGRQPGGQMTCTFDNATRVLESLGITKELGYDIEQLARGGAKANFFELRDHTIKPRIRLLARIAATVTPPTRA